MLRLDTYIIILIHYTYLYTCMRKLCGHYIKVNSCIHSYMYKYMRTYMHKYMRTHIHTYIHIHKHTYKHTHTYTKYRYIYKYRYVSVIEAPPVTKRCGCRRHKLRQRLVQKFWILCNLSSLNENPWHFLYSEFWCAYWRNLCTVLSLSVFSGICARWISNYNCNLNYIHIS